MIENRLWKIFELIDFPPGCFESRKYHRADHKHRNNPLRQRNSLHFFVDNKLISGANEPKKAKEASVAMFADELLWRESFMRSNFVR